MRRSLLLAGVLLLLVAGLFLLLRQEEPGADPVHDGGSASGAEAAAGGFPSTDGAQPAAQDPGIGRSEAPVEPPPGADGAEPAHGGPWMNVEVVRGEAALPAPHARVTVLTPDPDRQEELMMLFLTGISVPELLSSQGAEYPADKTGKARVPMPRDSGLIAAELEDGFVMVEWSPVEDAAVQDRELRLVLEPASSIEVLVVDAQGRPLAGAPVSIRFGDENFQMDFLRDFTGADGVARMQHVPMFLRSFTPGVQLPCSVALVAPLPAPVSAPLDLLHLPDAPITLVMPDSGAVEVQAQLVDGTPVADGQVVFLSLPRERPEDDDDFFVPGLPGFDSIAVRTKNGIAAFPFVGIGMELMATSVFPNAPEATRQRGRGPERAGETSRWVMKESMKFPVLTGRLLASDGAPLAGLTAELRVLDEVNEFGMERSRKLTIAADGGFRLAMRSNEMIPQPQPAEFMISDSSASGALLAAFEIPPLREGENPVGDLRARAAPVLASGRVVGPDSAPIPGATVCPMNWIQWDEDDPGSGVWMDDYDHEVECAADGSFVIYGAPRAGALRLVAEAPGHLRLELDAEPGARDLLIRLEAGGTLRGRLLVDPGTPLEELAVSLLVAGEPEDEGGRQWASINPGDGSFTITGLRPGVGVILVTTGWSNDADDEAVARVEGVRFGPGAELDPRLDPLDLRGRLHSCRIRARAEDGAVIRELAAWPEQDPESQAHGWHGEVTVVSAAPLDRLVISASGYRMLTVQAQPPITEVVLIRGPEVLLRLPPSAARFDGIVLGVQVVRTDEDGLDWTSDPRGFFAADGTLRLHLQAPGTYAAMFMAERGSDPDAESWEFSWVPLEDGFEHPSFVVADVAGAQHISLPPPSVASVLAALNEDARGSGLVVEPFQR